MDFKALVGGLKERYEGFVSKLEEKGVPHARLLVPLTALLVVAVVVFLVFNSFSIVSYKVSVVDLNTSSPIAGANVSVFSNGVLVASGLTDSNGNVVFNLSSGGYTFSASSSGYASSPPIQLVNGAVVKLESLVPPSKSVVISVEQNGQPVFGNPVTLSFSDGSSVNGLTDINGNASVQVPVSEVSGGASLSVNGNVIPVSSSELSSGLVVVNLTSTSPQNAVLYVLVSASGQPVSGAQVSVLNAATQSVLASGFTDSTGSASFNVSLGSTVYVTASAAGYGSGYSNSFVFNASQSVNVQLSRVSNANSNLTLSVLDENGNLVSGASVLVFTQSNEQVASLTTQGAPLSIPLAPGVFYANVQYPGYLPVVVENLKSGMVKSVSLTPLTAGGYANVSVLVLENGEALPGASVSFYTSDGLFLFNSQSDGSGMVEASLPLTLNSQPYSFYVNGSYNSLIGESDVFEIGNDNITLPLAAPPARLSVSLVDFTSKAPVTGFVNVVVGGNIINTCNGTSCVLKVPGETGFNLNVQAQGYLPFTSSVLTYASGSLNSLTIPLYSLSLVKGASASFIGLFDSNGERVLQVVNGASYTARFLVSMPVSTSSAYFYVRVGEEGNSSTDPAFITGYTPASFIQTGGSYPQDCTAGDNPSSQAKWLLWSFPRGFVGSKEVDVKIQVSLNASPSTPIVLYYKAFGELSNGLSVFSPVNTVLSESNFSLSSACNSNDFNQNIPFSPNPLVCSVINNHEFCYSISFSSNGFNSLNFNPVLGQQFQINLNVLSDVGINGLILHAPGFKVTQSFSRSKTLGFQSSNEVSTALQEQVLSASSNDVGSFLQNSLSSSVFSGEGSGIQIPFTANANQLSSLSLTLTPTTPTFYAPLSFNFQADDGSALSFSKVLSVQGAGSLNVQVSPSSWTAPGSVNSKITVTDAFGNPVGDATVSLTECYGSPFNGNPPAVNSQGGGVYSFQSQLFGGGVVGFNVQAQGYKSYSGCNVNVREQSFLSVSPSSLVFSGDSLNPISQQVTVQNLINNPVKVSSVVNCYTGPNIFTVTPPFTSIPASGSTQLSVNVIPNSTGNSQCVLNVVGVDGNSRDSEQVQLSGSVSCPECVLNQEIAYGLSNLPSTIPLYPTGPQTVGQIVYGFNAIPVQFPTAPTCSLTLTQGPGGLGFAGGVYPGFAMTPQGAQFVQYGCQSCTDNGDGSFACQGCQSGWQGIVSCEVCQPENIEAPSTYSSNILTSRPGYLVLWPSATCSGCVSPQNAGLVASSLTSTNGLISLPIAQQGFYAGVFGSPFMSGWYPGGFGMGFPGSPFSINSFGQGQASCTASQIQVSAPLNPFYPISGVLTLSFSNGMTAQIQVVGPPAGYIGVMGIKNATPQEKCNLPNSFTVNLDNNFKEVSSTNAQVTCNSKIIFSQVSLTLQGKSLNGNLGCQMSLNNNVISVQGCDFSGSDSASQAIRNYFNDNGNLNGLSGSSVIGIPGLGKSNVTATINFTVNGGAASWIQIFNDSDFTVDFSNQVIKCPVNGLGFEFAFPSPSTSQGKSLKIVYNNDSVGKTASFTLDSVKFSPSNTGSYQLNSSQLAQILNESDDKLPSKGEFNLSVSIWSGGQSLSTTTVKLNFTDCGTQTPPAPAPAPAPAPEKTPLPSRSDFSFYQQFNVGGFKENLFTLQPTTQPYSLVEDGYVLLTPSTRFIILHKGGDFNASVVLEGQNEESVFPCTGDNEYDCLLSSSSTLQPLNCVNVVLPLDKEYDCLLSSFNVPSGYKAVVFSADKLFKQANKRFKQANQPSYRFVVFIYLNNNKDIYYVSNFKDGTITKAGQQTNNAATLYISYNYLANPNILGSAGENSLSACDTPTPHVIGNIWVFKTTMDSPTKVTGYSTGSFDIISTTSGNTRLNDNQQLYLYGCTSSVNDLNSISPKIESSISNFPSPPMSNPKVYINNNVAEFYESIPQISVNSETVKIRLTVGANSRYYCQSWPKSAEDVCDGSNGNSEPQELSTNS